MSEQDAWLGRELGNNGRYKIAAKLGEGGMGAVYRAWDSNLKTDVVIKVPHASNQQDTEATQRFAREASSLVKLSYPHIVKIIDFGTHAGLPFAVMQFLSGGSLASRQGDEGQPPKKLPAESLRDWLPSIAKALDFVHAQGYLHRDVKPANILFDSYGNAFLSDFGITKFAAARQSATAGKSLTGAGMVLGTPEYMAPEVILGQPADGRLDQYGLAVTVYEVLAGRRPFEDATATAVLVQQTAQQPPDVRTFNGDVSPALAAVIQKALSKEPAKRFGDCVAFADAAIATISARSSGQFERPKLKCPACQQTLKIESKLQGKTVPCPACQSLLKVSNDLQELSIAESQGQLDSIRRGTRAVVAGDARPSSSGTFRISADGASGAPDDWREHEHDSSSEKTDRPTVPVTSGKIPTRSSTTKSAQQGKSKSKKKSKKRLSTQSTRRRILIGLGSGLTALVLGVVFFRIYNSRDETQTHSNTVYVNESYHRLVRRLPDGKWEVVDDKTGDVKDVLEEVNRTTDSVELHSPSRPINYRLLPTRIERKIRGTWTWIANGHWDAPTQQEVVGAQSVSARGDDTEPVSPVGPGRTSAAPQVAEQSASPAKLPAGATRQAPGAAPRQLADHGFPRPPEPHVEKPADYDQLATGRWVAALASQAEFERIRREKTYLMVSEPRFVNGILECNNGLVTFPQLQGKDAIIRAQVNKVDPTIAVGVHVYLVLRRSNANEFVSVWCNGDGYFGICSYPPFTNLMMGQFPGSYNARYVELAFAAVGDKLTAYVDGHKILEARDDHSAEKRAGIGVGATCRGLFGDIEVQVLDEQNKLPGANIADLSAAATDDFVPLFNGSDLTGWKTDPRWPGNWRVENGILIGSGPSAKSFLYTERGDFKDFHLRAEARINDGGNSGIYFRSTDGPGPNGYEAQIDNTSPVNRTGSLYASGTPVVGVGNTLVPPGEWFTEEVIARGNRITIKVNGHTTAVYRDNKATYAGGHIALEQDIPKTIAEFRKIEIMKLGSPASSALNRKRNDSSASVAPNGVGPRGAIPLRGRAAFDESATKKAEQVSNLSSAKATPPEHGEPEVFADFESGSYGRWTKKGTAFGSRPARGTLPHQGPVSGFGGQGLVNTFFRGDQSMGTLTSPQFTIRRPYIQFRIGGGRVAGVGMNLVSEGKVVRTATGANNERLEWDFWDVSDLRGKTARIVIFDKATGPWGHINVDDILFADEPPGSPPQR